MLCWFQFCDEDGHDEDLTGDVWLADWGTERNVRDSSAPGFLDILLNTNKR